MTKDYSQLTDAEFYAAAARGDLEVGEANASQPPIEKLRFSPDRLSEQAGQVSEDTNTQTGVSV